MSKAEEREVSLAEAAVQLRISPFQAYQLVCRGELEGVKRGARWVVSRASLEAYRRGQQGDK
jgi:hypothetical protein